MHLRAKLYGVAMKRDRFVYSVSAITLLRANHQGRREATECFRPFGVILGMTPNAVTSLAFRAREGLREAYLQTHMAETVVDLESSG